MIEYDKHLWTSHLFDIQGSMVREILGRVSLCVFWASLVVATHQLTPMQLDMKPTIHTLVGVALGLLLVFRTNASYDRFWEGRKKWGAIVNESRNLARGTRAYVSRDGLDLVGPILSWTAAFPYATMAALRPLPGFGEGAPIDRLPKDEVEGVLRSHHIPLAVAERISALLAEARDRGAISDVVLAMLDNNVQLLVDYLGSCERIKNTPLPFVYVVHLRRALIVYCFTLPFALVADYGWWTILVALLASYMFFGIDEIGVEIENPFDGDLNDLPLERFCETIARDVLALIPEAAA